MWICAYVEHQGDQRKQRAMMTLLLPSKAHHVYGNGNQDTTTFLEIDVEVDKNEATTARSKVPLEII